MRKQSMMGSSKYEFNPKQFDIDVMEKLQLHQEKKERIAEQIDQLLMEDPFRIGDTFSLIIEVLREAKQKHNI
jgi:Txe/YoeB family toxin of Txe-Axe toxin-antitoxin module